MKRILILYTELAGYTIACIEALVAKGNIDLLLLKYPVNSEAPFRFKFPDSVRVIDRQLLNDAQLNAMVSEFDPQIILCSGWNDKGYMRICKEWRSKGVPVVLAMDNKWKGTLKQHVARFVAPFSIHRTFSHCWVPGQQQKHFAKKLGFSEERIATGFYACDYKKYAAVYADSDIHKGNTFPKQFIYAGRYYDFKGLHTLWEAFISFKKQTGNDWKLICVGTGDIEPVVHPDIEHRGFLQPDEMAGLMKEGGVFILPSLVEPWGVVVQEYAAAGFPLILSTAVGSGESFLLEGVNGFYFATGNSTDLQLKMKAVASLMDENLRMMSSKSHEMAKKITPETWSETLISFIKTK